MKYLLPLAFLLCSLISTAQDSRSDVDPALAPFYHGVASGDPLADRVILWTRITTQDATASVGWQIATDTNFVNIVNSGSVSTDANKDYTVKVDATGLQENTWYYYRFKSGNTYSIMGRTRTSPSGNVNNLRFAVVSCSDYENGYFNAYRDIVNKNDVDAVIHLGDYYYEYATGALPQGLDSLRKHEPVNEIVTLADYRMRNSQYKLDADLREVHRQYPFILVWDDHETANNSWAGGAENHTPGAEGVWADRISYGRRSYFEWMPIRDVYNSVDTIHRTIPMGGLVDIIMIDTRLEGREQQAGTSGAVVTDTNRTLLGANQLAWLKQQLSTSTAKWKIIGNQVMVSPLRAGTAALNEDQWDGYPAERTKILSHLVDNNIDNVVFLTGDIHTSWANDLPLNTANYTSSTGAGSVAVEYVCTSVTSGSGSLSLPSSLIQVFNPYIKYVDLVERGYVLLDATDAKVQGDWIYMSTVTDKNFTSSVGASWCDADAANRLTQCNSALSPRSNMPAQAPDFSTITGIKSTQDNVVMIATYPNPFDNEIAVQYYMNTPAKVELRITDVNGKTIYTQTENATQTGLYNTRANISNLAAGTYIVSVISGSKVYSQRIVKVK